jgi:SAM-dependent methyltransferase
MEWYEAAFDRFYPVVYGHRDEEEAERVVDSFEGKAALEEPILDLACGGGRYMSAYAKRGKTIFGLDLSHYLLACCADRFGFADSIVQGDMRRLPFRSSSVGSVINMFTSFGYFSHDTDNLMVLTEVHRVLIPGGRLLFDYLNVGRIAGRLVENTVRRSGDFVLVEKRRLDDKLHYLKKDIEIRNVREGTVKKLEERLRLYSVDELVSMFETMGFALLERFGDYDGNPFVEGVSDRVILLAEKRSRLGSEKE